MSFFKGLFDEARTSLALALFGDNSANLADGGQVAENGIEYARQLDNGGHLADNGLCIQGIPI